MESMEVENREIKKVIITGATGFIGFGLVEKLCELDIEVWAIVRNYSKTDEKLKKFRNVRIIYCDLDNLNLLQTILTEREFDIFYHFAWQGVSDQAARDIDIQLSNVKYACDAVEIAHILGCKRFIFASSIMEYEVMSLMETELVPDKRNVYRTAKITAHYLTKIVANNLSMKYNAAIISNVFGKGEVSNRFINSTLRLMLKGERAKFTEAKQMYDFVYIEDAAEMLMLIGQKGVNNKNYYIGSMQPRRLRDFICEMRECIDPSLELGIGEYKEYVGVSLNYDEVDINACHDDFDFKPRYSFQDGIIKTIEWMREMEMDK